MTKTSRRFALAAFPAFLLLAGMVGQARADDWVEPKFDPPVGSKWTIHREINVQKNSGGTMVGHTLKETALLTIEEKTSDGFVMSYARQNSSYDGDPAGAAVQRMTYAAEQGVVMKIVTDASGKPMRIANFNEVKDALKNAITTLPIASANPEALATLRRVAERMLAVDDKKAAEIYLDDLPRLALGQNTGVQPGELHKATLPATDPRTDGVTKVVTLSIAKDDPATGKVRYLMTETYDPNAMNVLARATLDGVVPAAADPHTLDTMMTSAKVAVISRAQLDVAGGMTRELRRQSVTSFQGGGMRSVTTEDELTTVSSATE